MAELEEKLGQALSTGRGPKDDEPQQNSRKRSHHEDGGEERGKRHHNNDGHRRHSGNQPYHQRRRYHQNHHQGQQHSPRGHHNRGDRRDHQRSNQAFSAENETRIRYKWTVSADQVRILTVHAFNVTLVTVSSNGNIVLDTAGHRTFRVFQALNMCLYPLGLKLLPDESQPSQQQGYKGGHWKLIHTKHKWALDFADGMKISAFPNRDWKKILPNLEALPESVVFSYESSHL